MSQQDRLVPTSQVIETVRTVSTHYGTHDEVLQAHIVNGWVIAEETETYTSVMNPQLDNTIRVIVK